MFTQAQAINYENGTKRENELDFLEVMLSQNPSCTISYSLFCVIDLRQSITKKRNQPFSQRCIIFSKCVVLVHSTRKMILETYI